MALVSVPAIKDFTYHGRSYVRGEIVTTEPVHASIMARHGYVSLSKHYQTRDITPDPEPVPDPRTKRRYRRRDMQAET